MRVFKRILDAAGDAAAWIAAIATILMMVHVTVDVIGRTVFNNPLTGTVEIVSAYNMAALAFLPLALITRERGHIIVELFTGWMKLRGRTLLDAFVAIVTFVYTATFTWKAVEIAIKKTQIREAKEAGNGFVEIWPSRWIVAVGFGLMAIYILINMAKDFRSGLSGKLDPADSERHGGETGTHVNPTEGQL